MPPRQCALPRAPPPRPRRGPLRDGAVTDVVGTMLLVAIAVVFASALSLVLLQIPPPTPSPGVALEAHLLRASPDTVVVEHRGGREVPIPSLEVALWVGPEAQRVNVGERIAAGDPAWSVRSVTGAPEGPLGSFGPGDQLRYRSALVPGNEVSIRVVDAGVGLTLHASGVRARDTAGPLIAAARTRTPTSLVVWFDEPLHNVSAADFRVNGTAPLAALLLADGTSAELTTQARPTNATPLVTAAPAPAGTTDLAWLPLQAGASATASDGVPPGFPSGPGVAAGVGTAMVSWTTDEPATSRVEYGPTPHLGRVASSPSWVQSHALSIGPLTPSTVYYYRVVSVDAAGNGNASHGTGSTGFFTSPAAPAGWPSFEAPVVNVVYPSVEVRDALARVGLSVLNPSLADIHLDLLRLRVEPPLGTGPFDAFFRAPLVSGLGSDLVGGAPCLWTGAESNVATCDPPGSFVVPARGMLQVVLEFRTSKANSGQRVALTGEAVLASGGGTLAHELSVLHDDSLMFELLGRSGAPPLGQATAGHRPGAAGTALDFHFGWKVIKGDAKVRTRFMVPPGWQNLSVPAQSSLQHLNVFVRAPTPTSAGYVDVAQDLPSGTREFSFRVTPPAHERAFVLQVDFEGSKEGSNGPGNVFQSLHWFAGALT